MNWKIKKKSITWSSNCGFSYELHQYIEKQEKCSCSAKDWFGATAFFSSSDNASRENI
jgi:hypothetical protein